MYPEALMEHARIDHLDGSRQTWATLGHDELQKPRVILDLARRAPPCPREGLSLPSASNSTNSQDESSFRPLRGRRATT